jgi:hypothetical protein
LIRIEEDCFFDCSDKHPANILFEEEIKASHQSDETIYSDEKAASFEEKKSLDTDEAQYSDEVGSALKNQSIIHDEDEELPHQLEPL